MTMPPGLRKLVLSAHIVLSVGWIGAVAAYMAFDVAAATSQDVQMLRAAYLGMKLIAESVIVPLAFASLVSGLVMSIGTKWGLFRHWWVVISLVLTVLATAVLVVETQTIRSLAVIAADPTSPSDELRSLGSTLVHSVGGTAILIVIVALNVYKPQGMTPYGWRRQREERRYPRLANDERKSMAADRIEAVNALLVETMEAHSAFEETELNGVFDQEWPRWYAAYAVDHGIGALVGHAVTTDQLAHFLASSNVEFEQAEPKPDEPWAAYTARRITAEL